MIEKTFVVIEFFETFSRNLSFFEFMNYSGQKLKGFLKKCCAEKLMSKIMSKITADLAPLVNDIKCREAFQILEEKEKVFDKLRQGMSIALPDTNDGLNHNGEDVEINTIENSLNDFK